MLASILCKPLLYAAKWKDTLIKALRETIDLCLSSNTCIKFLFLLSKKHPVLNRNLFFFCTFFFFETPLSKKWRVEYQPLSWDMMSWEVFAGWVCILCSDYCFVFHWSSCVNKTQSGVNKSLLLVQVRNVPSAYHIINIKVFEIILLSRQTVLIASSFLQQGGLI